MNMDEYFSCRTSNSKVLSNVLTSLCVNQKKEQSCYVCAEEDSLTISVTSLSKATRAKVSMDKDLFEDYQCQYDQSGAAKEGSGGIQFGLSLSTLLDCLTLTSSPEETSVSIMYDRRDALFRVTLEEAGVQTVCDLSVLVSDDMDDISSGLTSAFLNAEEEASIIFKSDALREAVLELTDTVGATEVRVEIIGPSRSSTAPSASQMLGSAHKLSSVPGGVVFSTVGNVGECEMVMSAESENIFVSFNCSQPRLVWVYPMTSVQLGMKALAVANETCLRINSDGIMALQHQVETERRSETYIDFLMVALDKPRGEQEGNHYQELHNDGVHAGAMGTDGHGSDEEEVDDFARGPFSSHSFGTGQ